MKQFNRSIGTQAEQMAADFLKRQGYQILEQNFSTRFGEIDLIAVTPRTVAKWSETKHLTPPRCCLVFIEVKTKSDDRFGTAEEMVTPRKISQVKKMAIIYLQKNPQIAQKYPAYRLDVVAINANDIKHYQNITE